MPQNSEYPHETFSETPKNEPSRLFNKPTKTLVVVAGPTAVGKTTLAVQLAQHYQTEVLSADARQFYRELNIGTAKPTTAEMGNIPHHFIDSHSISTLYSAGSYERDALSCLDVIFQKYDLAIMVGGSGLYIKALCEGLDDLPETPPALRQTLMNQLESEGIASLQVQLRQLDPDYYNTNDLNNAQRLVRALEVCLITGQPFSSFKTQHLAQRPFEIVQIAISRERDELYQRIDARMDTMLAQGLVEEARALLPYRQHNALQTVGYKEIFEYLDGSYDYAEMVRLLKRNSRRYAKRQITWFKHQGQFAWFDAHDFKAIVTHIEVSIKQ